MRITGWPGAGLLWLLALHPPAAAGATPADLVVTDARIYTVDTRRSIAEALAVSGGRIVFVGSAREARELIGPATEVKSLGGRLVLPGLVDAHVHPLDIAELDVCDLDNKPVSLRELTDFVRACLERYKTPAGELLAVHEWNYSDGNTPDAEAPTLRAALDRASTRVKIQLLGNDGHHGAFNSPALASAKNERGETVGFSRRTLATDFAPWRKLIGVDAAGEPNGAVNEDARYSINLRSMLYNDLAAVSEVPERIVQRLNSAGITAALDAMASPEGLPVYETLLKRGQLTVRVTLAQFYDPARRRTAGGAVDYDGMLAEAKEIRARYARHPLVRADTVKLFADGVLEGNPFAVPPTLPNAGSLHPFLQPIFGIDKAGHATVTGYVDTGSALCAQTRSHMSEYEAAEAAGRFRAAHGFHPAQCEISSGQLQHDRGVILEFVKRFHTAGFNLHIHAIGDLAVRTALDALEAARAADGIATTRDALAHVQLADPADVVRIGRDHLYVAFTYSWADTDPEYDTTVIPFIQHVSGNSYAALHVPGSYYEANAYPARAVRQAGAILVAGSDAPVETRDPRPFVNMMRAVTRRLPGLPALNSQQALTLREVLDAYTINGARLLGREAEIGSLEAGKSADFVVLDSDILRLADQSEPLKIADAHVLETWFMGKLVWASH
jgi:predicted amidohydrolase YtcJ